MLMSVLLQVLPHLTIWISIQVLIPVPHQVLIQFYPVFWFLCRTKLQSLYFLSYIWSSNLRYRYCSFFPLKMLLPNISSVANKQNIGLRTFPQVFFLLQVYFQVLWSSSKSYTTQWCTSFHFKSQPSPEPSSDPSPAFKPSPEPSPGPIHVPSSTKSPSCTPTLDRRSKSRSGSRYQPKIRTNPSTKSWSRFPSNSVS